MNSVRVNCLVVLRFYFVLVLALFDSIVLFFLALTTYYFLVHRLSSSCSCHPNLAMAEDNGSSNNGGIEVLRTPDACFNNLPGYPFAPNYLNVPVQKGSMQHLRMHFVDEGPRDGPVALLLHGKLISFDSLHPFLTLSSILA
jgi:hypothetical protein